MKNPYTGVMQLILKPNYSDFCGFCWYTKVTEILNLKQINFIANVLLIQYQLIITKFIILCINTW